MDESWLLMQKDVILGELSNPNLDMPVFFCTFRARPEFEQIRPLFDEELRLLNEEVMDEWETAYRRIDALKLRLKPKDGGRSIRRFILHVEGEMAWFRS